MSLNSVNTNMGAMIALESLNRTNADLLPRRKQISTGYRVADATDDGAAYAVAQSVRSTVGALTTANQQLGNVQGLLSTTQSGLNDVSNTMASMRDVLVNLSDTNVSGNQRTQYINSVQFAAGEREDVHPGRRLQRQDADRQYHRIERNDYARVALSATRRARPTASLTFGGSALYGVDHLHGGLRPWLVVRRPPRSPRC